MVGFASHKFRNFREWTETGIGIGAVYMVGWWKFHTGRSWIVSKATQNSTDPARVPDTYIDEYRRKFSPHFIPIHTFSQSANFEKTFPLSLPGYQSGLRVIFFFFLTRANRRRRQRRCASPVTTVAAQKRYDIFLEFFIRHRPTICLPNKDMCL